MVEKFYARFLQCLLDSANGVEPAGKGFSPRASIERIVFALTPPSGALWLHEIKHYGYRIIVCKTGDTVLGLLFIFASITSHKFGSLAGLPV